MNFRQHRISLVVGLVGALVVVAHVALGVIAVLTLSQWLSGTAIGLAVVVMALGHLAVGRHSRHVTPRR